MTPTSAHTRWHAAMTERADRDSAGLEGRSALDILRWADSKFGTELVVGTSMQDAVLVDLASQVRPGIDVIFLDTGYHFAETIGMRDAVRHAYPVNLRTIQPARTVAEQDAELGPRLYERDPDRCCALRKVRPLAEALAPYAAWVTGLRRVESPTRANAKPVEWDKGREMFKVNPIVAWSDDDVAAYIADRGVLTNPLRDLGYPSIGCAPCTRPVAAGADARSGRWAGSGKLECGLHG